MLHFFFQCLERMKKEPRKMRCCFCLLVIRWIWITLETFLFISSSHFSKNRNTNTFKTNHNGIFHLNIVPPNGDAGEEEQQKREQKTMMKYFVSSSACAIAKSNHVERGAKQQKMQKKRDSTINEEIIITRMRTTQSWTRKPIRPIRFHLLSIFWMTHSGTSIDSLEINHF